MWLGIIGIVSVLVYILAFRHGRKVGAKHMQILVQDIINLVFSEPSISVHSKKVLVTRLEIFLDSMLPDEYLKKRFKPLPEEPVEIRDAIEKT